MATSSSSSTPRTDATPSDAPTDLDMLRTRLEVSVGMARSLVASWLPTEDDQHESATADHTAADNSGQNRDDGRMFAGMTARARRLGLGAKYLSHRQATQAPAHKGMLSEDKLRRKLLGNQRSSGDSAASATKKSASARTGDKRTAVDDESDDEAEERKGASNSANRTDKRAATGHGHDMLNFYLGQKKKKKQKKSAKP
ncbi:hypothetical protein SYNPS1DRAFT_31340 [Syncephalis pseudoplumigaleata]|uniref:Uncharacterized protein n=1 Tax=Syncephalis pseudoplumigaleata TaxID=1712513 RepID=A0A4P9YVM1_9FUNG|nr:hypothetical protein SYNPS1DRAFT_31340 [Syncephalis pseudoplumigaleata]|eukprot:RKP22970.1 hypothetical protein SYNPS1DRAFT_31340 [Syncephalis pseudoplumigaleata]